MDLKVALNEFDKKEIRYMMRAGIIIPILFFPIACAVYVMIILNSSEGFDKIEFIIPFIALISVLLSLLINRKYRLDLKEGYKIARDVQIDRREEKKDFEAGSGTLYLGQKMNEFTAYYFIIENTRYRVEKELYESSYSGSMIYMFFTPHSNIHIGFGLME